MFLNFARLELIPINKMRIWLPEMRAFWRKLRVIVRVNKKKAP